MAHKRRREGDGNNHPFVNGGIGDGDGDGDVDSSGAGLVSLFGGDAIHEIEDGETTFARGGFGEVSIALKSRKQDTVRFPQSPSETSGTNLYSFVAVKTIHNAISGSGGNNRFGGFGGFGGQQQQQKLSSEVLSELLALRLLQPHPNIVPLVAVYPATKNHHSALSLAFEYCPLDLREVLEVRRRTFRQPLAFHFVQTIFQDVFKALQHCHENGILHRDLKPGNLLVSPNGVIRLCDFGLAKPFLRFDKEEQEESSTTGITKDKKSKIAVNNDKGLCTIYYRPPEVLLGGPSEYPSVDSWSAGVVLAEIISGRTLWPGRNVIGQLSLVFGTMGTPNEEDWPAVRQLPDYGKLNFGSKPSKPWEVGLPRAAESPMLVDLVSKLLVFNPIERLTAREALEHGWLRGKKTENTHERHRELRDELILPTSLQIPTVLFSENRALVEKIGSKIAESRRDLLSSSSKGQGIDWQGPTVIPFLYRE